MSIEVRLAFLGGATIYQGAHKFDATATLFAKAHRSIRGSGTTSGRLLKASAAVRQ